MISLIRWLLLTDARKCADENANRGWPHRYPGDGWRRRRDGSLIKGGCIRPVAYVPHNTKEAPDAD